MPSDEQEHDSASDSHDRFEDLIRAALRVLPESKLFPRPGSILAYIEGNATEEQSAEVQSALADSSEFQRLFLDIADTIHALSAPEANRLFEHMTVPALPLVKAHILSRKGLRLRRRSKSTLDRLTDLFSLRLFVPIGAAAAIAILAFTMVPGLRFWRQSATLSKITELDPSYFAGGVERGGSPLVKDTVAPTADQAAFAEFRRCISLDPASGAPSFRQHDVPLAERYSRRVVLTLIDTGTGEKRVCSALVPTADQIGAEGPIEAWLIRLPSLDVWHCALRADSIRVQLSLGPETRGCVVFTYPVESGYRSTAGNAFEIKQ